MISFVDAYCDTHGGHVGDVLMTHWADLQSQIAPSTYRVRREKPETAPPRVKRDTMFCVDIKRVFNENFQVYGVRKVWRQLLREGHEVGRCTVARLMKKEALQGG